MLLDERLGVIVSLETKLSVVPGRYLEGQMMAEADMTGGGVGGWLRFDRGIRGVTRGGVGT